MKRILTLLLALALAIGAASACAEGALTVEQENLHIVGTTSLYCYMYVKVKNTGDAPIFVNKGSFTLRDKEGNEIGSTTSLWRYAEYLQPGESTYAYFNPRIEGIESRDQVGDYDMNIEFVDNANKVTFFLPSESVFEDDVKEGSWTHDYLTTTVTNDLDQTVFDLAIARVLLDAKGNILYMDSDNMYSSKGLCPGSSIVERRQLNGSFEPYFEEMGYVPATVDGFAYVYVTDPSVFTKGGAGEAEPGAEPGAEPEAAAAAYATLQKGSKGDDVQAMQQRLKDLGYLKGKADGDFGNGTEKAVTAFQKKAGLPQNGIADDATQKALFADDAPTA